MSIADLNPDLAEKTTADIQYKIAATQEERTAAFRLVYNCYLRSGLGEPNPHEMRVTPYHLLPTTEIFLASYDDEPIFTVTLVIDGNLGLPMEPVYGREVALFRQWGLYVGEVSCLADRRKEFRGFFPVFLRLSRLVVQYARRRGLDGLLLAVHPRHARFYERFMDFELFGQQKAYPAVRNAPAVALFLDFARVDRERPENYDTFFGEPLPDEMLRPCPIPAAQQEFFRPLVDARFEFVPIANAGYSSGSPGIDSPIGIT